MFKTSEEELQYGWSPETAKPPLKMLKSTPDLNRTRGNNCSEGLSNPKSFRSKPKIHANILNKSPKNSLIFLLNFIIA